MSERQEIRDELDRAFGREKCFLSKSEICRFVGLDRRRSARIIGDKYAPIRIGPAHKYAKSDVISMVQEARK